MGSVNFESVGLFVRPGLVSMLANSATYCGKNRVLEKNPIWSPPLSAFVTPYPDILVPVLVLIFSLCLWWAVCGFSHFAGRFSGRCRVCSDRHAAVSCRCLSRMCGLSAGTHHARGRLLFAQWLWVGRVKDASDEYLSRCIYSVLWVKAIAFYSTKIRYRITTGYIQSRGAVSVGE